MALDDERTPWPAAEALERGENPQREDTARFRLARLLAEHDDVHTIHHQMIVAGRVLAFLPRIVAWVEQDKPAKAGVQLRQQQVATADDETHYIETAHHHLQGYREAMAVLVKMGSRAADGYDPDFKGERDDVRREREAAQDEAAASDAPRIAS